MNDRTTHRTLLHIGGGALQLPAIRWAHEAGLQVVVTDADSAAPGRELADRFFAIADSSIDELVDLACGLDDDHGLIGVYASDPGAARAVAAIRDELGIAAHTHSAVEVALDPNEAREALRGAGLPTSDDSNEPGADALRLEVNGFFRDGAFVPAGMIRLERAASGVRELGLTLEDARCSDVAPVYRTVEVAARALDLVGGPVGAEVLVDANGISIVSILPTFCDEVTTEAALPLSIGKSPVQAWFATLSAAGAPFDAMPTEHNCLTDSLGAGWIAIRAEVPGRVESITGLDRASLCAGVEGLCILAQVGDELPDPGDERALVGYLWGTGWDAEEVERRLRAARECIDVRVRERSAA